MSSGRRDPGVSRLGRFVRGRRLDRNPLRRPSDRAESAVLAVLVIAFIAAAPFAALAGGAWGHAIAHRVQAAQPASRYLVAAVVLQAPQGSQAAGSAALAPEAQARWTAPDGKVVTSVEVPTPAPATVGTVIRVWVTRDGQLTDAPLLNTQVAGQADLAATSGVVALAVTLALTGVLARRVLDRRRMAAWDADWRVTGGHWTRRA